MTSTTPATSVSSGSSVSSVSSGATSTSVAIEQRLNELEIKASFADDLLDSLNALVARQQEQIDLLLREVVRLRRQDGNDGMGQPRNLRDELPPHY